ncbi:hypothetical protein F5Y17DRAFT_442152 [Xylariaceae sp. FL0594]|nr:hypothetical protein F5Y17DRAFT_442152 [Xylariaceae sp. FL0594]
MDLFCILCLLLCYYLLLLLVWFPAPRPFSWFYACCSWVVCIFITFFLPYPRSEHTA